MHNEFIKDCISYFKEHLAHSMEDTEQIDSFQRDLNAVEGT